MYVKLEQTIPQHGLAWFSVPKKMRLRGAKTLFGEKLVSQFLPSAFENRNTEGFLLVRIPENVTEIELTEETEFTLIPATPFVSVCNQGVKVETANDSFCISDSVHSSEECQHGTYYLFHREIKAVASEGPLFDVCRVQAVPTDKNNQTIGNTVVHYDFVRMKDIPLIQILSCYHGEKCWSVNDISFTQLVIPKAEFSSWAAGNPACGGTFDLNPETGTVPILESTIPVVPFEGVHGYKTDFEHYFSLSGKNQSIALVGGQVTVCFYPHVLYGEKYWQIGFRAMNGQQNLMSIGSECPLMGSVVVGDAAKLAGEWCKKLPPIIQIEEESNEQIALDAGDLSVQLRVSDDSIRLFKVTDQKTGYQWLKNGNGDLFRATIRNIEEKRNIWVSSAGNWKKVNVVKEEGQITLSFEESKLAPGFSLKLHAQVDPKQNRIEWRGEFENLSEILSVLECDYPRLNFEAPENSNILTPYLSGHVHYDYGKSHTYWNEHYATLWCSMPLLSCWDTNQGRGLYYAAHDAKGCTKRVCLDKHMGQSGTMTLSYSAENALIPGNSQMMGGKAVWQLYDGDWYDAAMIYRQWALKEACWLPKLNEKNVRTDSPEWLHDIGLWCIGVVTDEKDWVQPILDLQKEMDVPIAVHLYQWHQIPFDTCYPHYFPVKQNTLSGIQRLQEANIRVIPYINGRLWDVNDGEDFVQYTGIEPKFTFEREGKEIATTREDGSIIREAYISRRLNGERVRLNGVCLSQTKWHDIIEHLSERMYDELGIDGIYVDQTAGCSYATCYNPRHGHPLGIGGTWHIEGIRQMMQRLSDLRLRKGLESIYITEDHSEQFIDVMDGMLVWHWSSGGLVPAFSAVYSDQVELFGRNYPLAEKLSEEDRKYARITFAEQMTFGDQLGWNVSFLKNSGRVQTDMDMYKQAIQLRYEYKEYYSHGRLCRPPKVACDAPDIVVHRTNDYHTNCLYGHPVTAGLRSHPVDGSKLLTIVNITDQDQTCELFCDLPDGKIRLVGALQEILYVKNGKLTLTIPAFSTVMGISK
ncbi:MAG: DUF6259 domain-containing protein [Christensenellales bacterium]|jgi:hypothetical protein